MASSSSPSTSEAPGAGVADSRLLQHMVEMEEAAEDVLSDRREVVDLDRRRQENRRALRAVQDEIAKRWDGESGGQWLALGNTFLELPGGAARNMIQADQVELDERIRSLRDGLPAKVNRLRDLEGLGEAAGFGRLAAADRSDLSVLGK